MLAGSKLRYLLSPNCMKRVGNFHKDLLCVLMKQRNNLFPRETCFLPVFLETYPF